MFLLKTLPKTRTNYFWNPCRRYSARSESRSRSCHFIKKILMKYPGQGEFSFDEAANFFLPCAEVFRQNPNMMTEIYNFLQKKISQKVWWDTLNAALTSLPNFLPDVHNPSGIFHCSKIIVPLIAKPWVGGIQLWRTSKIVSRNPEFYRQKYQNDKFFTPTGQIVFAYSPNVMTKTYSFLPKNFFRQVFFCTICIHVWKFCREKNFRSANSLHSWSKNNFGKIILP